VTEGAGSLPITRRLRHVNPNMQIQFRQSVADDRGSFTAGQVVSVKRLPRGWQQWLEAGVIRLLPEDATETAVRPEEPDQAVIPTQRTRRARRSTVAR
jgi:hypothetical protein